MWIKIFWKWKIFSAQKLPIGSSNGSRHKDTTWPYGLETYLWNNFVKNRRCRRRPPLWKIMKSAITWKLYKLETHIFKDKECNETMIFILRPQQLQQNPMWWPWWPLLEIMKSAIFQKINKLETHSFKDKECNETMIFILRSQQLQQNPMWWRWWPLPKIMKLTITWKVCKLETQFL